MARSLKERYQAQRLEQLKERAEVADKVLLEENKASVLLTEAMDEQDLQKVSAIIDKLSQMKSSTMPVLTKGIEAAQAEINRYTAGGPISKAWNKLKTKVGVDNPIVKVSTLASSLEKGFGQLPQILKNNGIKVDKDTDLTRSLQSILVKSPTGAKSDKEMSDRTVTNDQNLPNNDKSGRSVSHDIANSRVGAKSDNEMGKSPFSGKDVGDKEKIDTDQFKQPQAAPVKKGTPPTAAKVPQAEPQPQPAAPHPPKKKPVAPSPSKVKSKEEGTQDQVVMTEADPPADEKLKSVIDQLRTALSPGGFFGAFKKVPYVDSDALAQELASVPVKELVRIAKLVKSGAKSSDIAPDLKAQINGQGGAETKGTKQTDPAKPTSQTEPTQPAKQTVGPNASTPTGQQPPAPRGGAGGDQQSTARKMVSVLNKEFGVDEQTAVKILRKLSSMGAQFPKDAAAPPPKPRPAPGAENPPASGTKPKNKASAS